MGALIELGQGYDVTFKLTADLKTSTADYTPVFMTPGAASGADKTVHGILTEATDNLHPIGILQADNSANATYGQVRLFGESKCYAGATIQAGAIVGVADSSLGTADVGGKVLTYDPFTPTVDESGTSSHTFAVSWALGRAVEAAAATGDALTIFVNPQVMYYTA